MENNNPIFQLEKFKEYLHCINSAPAKSRKFYIQHFLKYEGFKTHYSNKGYKILAEESALTYDHEFHTCKKLVHEGYTCIFVPKVYSRRTERKFDVFVITENALLEMDLKSINFSG